MLFLILAACLSAPVAKTYDSKFAYCYDGDTCFFDVFLDRSSRDIGLGITQETIISRSKQCIRLCDIDAPEIKPGPNPAAIKAKDDLVSWITKAGKVQIVVPQKKNCLFDCDQFDKYGRLLGYIIADGVNLNLLQLSNKNAEPFTKCE